VAVSQMKALGRLFAATLPALVSAFVRVCNTLGTPSEGAAVERLYRELPVADLSRDVLASRPESLAVLRVAGVGWDDVGLPARAMARLSAPAVAARPEAERFKKAPRAWPRF
jgi:hypothetical protein